MQNETQKIEKAIIDRTNKHGDAHEGQRDTVLALILYLNNLPLSAAQARMVFSTIDSE